MNATDLCATLTEGGPAHPFCNGSTGPRLLTLEWSRWNWDQARDVASYSTRFEAMGDG
jgi:hypothetical protein